MSRVAKNPISLPKGLEVQLSGDSVSVKGAKGSLSHTLHRDVQVVQEDGQLRVAPRHDTPSAWAQAGTARALLSNMVKGCSEGFSRSLELVGVGYRAQMKGRVLSIAVGYSHPVEMPVPEGLTVETPTQTQVVVRGADRQRVGQLAANIRAVRPPEPYKGKGIRYSDEVVVRKEAKKKK
ncbi:MAG: 50S ribosomal protein L6 [Immundisolibacter sp.]